MATPVIMPRQGQSVESCIISRWFKSPGELVKKGDILFSYETDKASFETEAETNGFLIQRLYEEGSEVPVLQIVAYLGSEGEQAPQVGSHLNPKEIPDLHLTKESKTEIHNVETQVSFSETIQNNTRKIISPRAKIRAVSLGLDIKILPEQDQTEESWTRMC